VSTAEADVELLIDSPEQPLHRLVHELDHLRKTFFVANSQEASA
jgi:hypothetical protein